jgi:hypothetical protein
MEIAILELLSVTDHILIKEKQHWVSVAFIARHVFGIPKILESSKCIAIGWFPLLTLPEPLSSVSEDNFRIYNAKYGIRHIS